MPTLNHIECHVEWESTKIPFKEYGVSYDDGVVDCYIAVPEAPVNFSLHLQSHGYIAPGIAMFVYMDGVYQCNRNRFNLNLPDVGVPMKNVEVDFRVRQKEERRQGGGWVGRSWRFDNCQIVICDPPDAAPPKDDFEDLGTIQVIVLRCTAGNGNSQPLSAVFGVPVSPTMFGSDFDTSGSRSTGIFTVDGCADNHRHMGLDGPNEWNDGPRAGRGMGGYGPKQGGYERMPGGWSERFNQSGPYGSSYQTPGRFNTYHNHYGEGGSGWSTPYESDYGNGGNDRYGWDSRGENGMARRGRNWGHAGPGRNYPGNWDNTSNYGHDDEGPDYWNRDRWNQHHQGRNQGQGSGRGDWNSRRNIPSHRHGGGRGSSNWDSYDQWAYNNEDQSWRNDGYDPYDQTGSGEWDGGNDNWNSADQGETNDKNNTSNDQDGWNSWEDEDGNDGGSRGRNNNDVWDSLNNQDLNGWDDDNNVSGNKKSGGNNGNGDRGRANNANSGWDDDHNNAGGNESKNDNNKDGNHNNFDNVSSKPASIAGSQRRFSWTTPLSNAIPNDEPPKYTVPDQVAEDLKTNHQVQPGASHSYWHKKGCPSYMDTFERPYARFVFRYRSREVLENELGIAIEEDQDDERKRLAAMSKDQIIDMLLSAQDGHHSQTCTPRSPTPIPLVYVTPKNVHFIANQPLGPARPAEAGSVISTNSALGSDEIVPTSTSVPCETTFEPPKEETTAVSDENATKQTHPDTEVVSESAEIPVGDTEKLQESQKMTCSNNDGSLKDEDSSHEYDEKGKDAKTQKSADGEVVLETIEKSEEGSEQQRPEESDKATEEDRNNNNYNKPDDLTNEADDDESTKEKEPDLPPKEEKKKILPTTKPESWWSKPNKGVKRLRPQRLRIFESGPFIDLKALTAKLEDLKAKEKSGSGSEKDMMDKVNSQEEKVKEEEEENQESALLNDDGLHHVPDREQPKRNDNVSSPFSVVNLVDPHLTGNHVVNVNNGGDHVEEEDPAGHGHGHGHGYDNDDDDDGNDDNSNSSTNNNNNNNGDTTRRSSFDMPGAWKSPVFDRQSLPPHPLPEEKRNSESMRPRPRAASWAFNFRRLSRSGFGL